MLRSLILVLLLAPPTLALGAECAPAKMVRIVTRDATPGLDPQSFAAQPKTLHRVGNNRGRIEEVADAAHGIHGLIVVNEPNVWMVNLADRSGQHIVDPGPSLVFRAPILADAAMPSPLGELEFGCELAFIQAHAARRSGQVDVGGGLMLDKHEVTRGPHRIAFLVRPKDRMVFSVTYYKDGKVARVLRYLECQRGLAPDARLFVRPQGIRFTEGQSATARP